MDTRLRTTEFFFINPQKLCQLWQLGWLPSWLAKKTCLQPAEVVDNHGEGKPQTSIWTANRRPRTTEKGLGENLKRAHTGPETVNASSTRPEWRAQSKKTIIIVDFPFSYSAKKCSKSLCRKLPWNSTRPLPNLEFRPFRKQWKFRLRRWDINIESSSP